MEMGLCERLMWVDRTANRDDVNEKCTIQKGNMLELRRERLKKVTYEMHVQSGENKLCLMKCKWKIISLDFAVGVLFDYGEKLTSYNWKLRDRKKFSIGIKSPESIFTIFTDNNNIREVTMKSGRPEPRQGISCLKILDFERFEPMYRLIRQSL